MFRKILSVYSGVFRSGDIISCWLWLLLAIKLVIIFLVLRCFFFRDYLGSRFGNDHDKSNYVIDQLTNIK